MWGGPDGDGEGAASPLQEVSARLEELGRRLDGVASGQTVVETLVRKIHQDLHLALGRSDALQSGHLSDGKSPTAVQRSESRLPTGERAPPDALARRSTEPSRRQSEAGKEATFDRAKAEKLGFWPRRELKHLKSNNHILPLGSRISVCDDLLHWSSKRRRLQPIHPDSWRRAFFDFASVIVLLYDSLMIPYQFAWHLRFSGAVAVTSWVTSIFWVVDLILGFLTGYHVRDKVVMDFRKIAKRYLATGFFLNLVVVVADLVGNILEMMGDSDALGMQKTLIKLMRFLKLNRVWRLSHSLRHGKVAEGWDWLATLLRRRGLDEQFNFISRVCRLVFYIMWVNHLGGCLWHMIGETGTSFWYLEADWEAGQQDKTNAFEYLLAFYWSASSMIAGGSIMKPRTTFELLMTVFCVVFGFIFSSVLISSLLTTVIEFQEANKEQYEKLKTLRQFLYQHGVDSRLAVPLTQQVHERMGKKKRLAEGDVDALSLLSPMMRHELWYNIYGPSVADNPILCACNAVDDELIKGICFRALDHQSHMPGSRIFEPLSEAVGTYFVYHGSLEYMMVQRNNGVNDQADREQTEDISLGSSKQVQPILEQAVEKGSWVSTMALWAHWMHRGWLDATKASELLTVQAEPFLEVLSAHVDVIPVAKTYSNCLLSALEQEPNETLTDLELGITHQSVVAAMPLEMRILLSEAAMAVLESKQQWSGRLFQQQGIQELNAEIRSGDCDLMVDAKENVKRVVTIVALRLSRSDGAILTQIGKSTKGVIMSSCQPPGSKIKVGEYPKIAVERLVNQKLADLGDSISIESHSVDEEERLSRKYGVSSTYMRTLYQATLRDEHADYMLPLSRTVPPTSSASVTKIAKGISQVCRSKSFDPTAQYEAFVFKRDLQKPSGTTFIYAWLSPDDFTFLSSEAGEAQLQNWVGELQMEDVRPTPMAESQPPEFLYGVPAAI